MRPFILIMGTISHTTIMQNKDMLVSKLKRYNELYRKGEPEISDVEYDSMVEQLRQIDPENEWLKNAEPGVVSVRRKVKLPIPMKSLNKTKSLPDIRGWLKSLALNDNEIIIVTPKFDGLSLLYSNLLKKAFSRGGAENEGQDCTLHYNMLPQYPDNNNIWNCVFGEFVFNRKQWETHFAGKSSPETGDKYKSPRNTAAGFLNRDEPSELIKHIDFYRYGIDSRSLENFNTYKDVLIELCTTFNQEPLFGTVKVQDLSEELLHEYFKQFSEQYYIDGLVLYINDLNIWNRVGRHQSTGNPLYAIAYKHPDFTDSFQTTVKDITWKVSKSGALKPVVNIETVDTGDCNMENPTGYNAAWINQHEIATGAEILVTRSGGVIPKILSTLKPATKTVQEELWDKLAECPHCGAPTAWNENYVELCCTNKECSGVQLAKMIFFYVTCGAENVGEETLGKIYNAGFTSIPQLLNITFDELMAIEGFGEGVSNIILENNQKIKSGVEIFTLMHASDCFTGIGKIKAKKIIENLGAEKSELFYNLKYSPLTPTNLAYHELSKTQQAFESGVEPFYRFIKSVNIPILKPIKQNIDKNGKYAEMFVCFSGVRDASLESLIISEGGTVMSGVNKKTTHLIVKDINGTSSKITKARQLSCCICKIEDFKQMIN